MLLPLVVLAGLSIVGGVIQLPFMAPRSSQCLEHWLEPVIEFGEARHRPARGPTTTSTLLMVIAVVGRGRRHRRRLARLRAAHGSRPSSRRSSPTAWYYDQTVSAFMGGPGREAFEGVGLVRRATSSTARSTAPARSCAATAGELRKGQTGYVRGYAGDHRHRRRRACSPGSSSCGGSCSGRDVRGRVPDPHRARPRAGRRRARSSPLDRHAPARARQARRPCSPAWPPAR